MMEHIAQTILHEIIGLHHIKPRLLVAIDGRCAAGKSTLAARLQKGCDCNVFHMDHFFLRPEQQTAERRNEPGGNVDYERFQQEVLEPIKKGAPFSYAPYDCHTREMTAPIHVEPRPIHIIEGAYSCHPQLSGYYDIKVFLTVNRFEQLQRIQRRNGAHIARRFVEMWIPMEEGYFEAFRIKEQCHLCFHTDGTCTDGHPNRLGSGIQV